MSAHAEMAGGPRASRLRLALFGLVARLPRASIVKRALRRLGVGRFLPSLVDKYYVELAWQHGWAELFRANRPKVLEYWKRYRCFDEVLAICRLDERSTVLDVGCGISTVLHFLPGRRYGIDPLADEYRKIYAYPPELNIQKGFGEQVPFDDAFFDVVFCSNVLDHTSDPGGTVREIRRVLKPGGHFVVTVEIFDAARPRDPSHPHSLTRGDVDALLAGQFETVFERTGPWILMMHYVDGSMRLDGEQLIAVLRKP